MSLQHKPESRAPIAVTGIGCWYPGARNPTELWENILTRRKEFRQIPDCRLPNAQYCDPEGNDIDKTYAQRCAVLDGFEFDWIGKRIPKTMFESTDPVHWLSLEVADQALRDAGYTKENMDRDGTGVIVGNTLTSDITRSETMRLRWPYVSRVLEKACDAHGVPREAFEQLENSMETMYKSVFAIPTADSLAGGLANTIAGRVCNYFDFHGGGYIVDGACSSSLLAVCTAARALAVGDLNVALAGGVDLSIDPFELVGFSRAGALSRGDMNVYDRDAAGFIAGEGCGFVVLKRLDDARRDGDQVYAVLKGWGISSDGKGGIMTPSSKGQASAIKRAYVHAGYTPADLDFVEGHGTGTTVGDQVELRGVFQAQSDSQVVSRRTGMTSLKSIIGHTKAAAGIGAFIKATMAVNRRVLPPTGSCTEPNPVFKDACTTLYPLRHGSVADPAGVIRAGVSAMGFGGINSHITLESGDAPSEKLLSKIDEHALMACDQTSEVFPLTALTFEQLTTEITNLRKVAAKISIGELIDLSAELSLRAAAQLQSPIRAAVVASSVVDLLEGLDELLTWIARNPLAEGQLLQSANENVWMANRRAAARVGFLFPGQGSQQLQMARKLVARYDWAREMVALADRVQASSGLPTLSRTVFVDVQRAIDNATKAALRQALARTEVAQVAIVTASAIVSRYLKQMGVTPVACGGHSLGELSALHETGAFDFEALLKLASLRGKAMSTDSEQAGAMAALFCNREQAQQFISKAGGYAVLANINSPSQVVISGDEATVHKVMELAAAREISTARLNVSNAFHSKFVQQAAETLRQQAPVPQTPAAMNIEVESCVSGESISVQTNLKDYLSKQVVSSVDFVSMVNAVASKCDLLLEVGPNRVLSRLASEALAQSQVACLPTSPHPDNDCDMNRALAVAFVNGVNVQWDRLFESRIARPFVPAEERVFIVNPCEKPIADVESKPISLAPSEETELTAASTSKPGNGSAATEHQNSNFSKSPLPNPIADRLSSAISHSDSLMHNRTGNSPSQENSTTTATPMNHPRFREENSAPPEMAKPSDGIEELIIDIVAERTGFPKESITPDLRLLDDLNMDSIKAGDIIATAARKLGALGPIDPATLADASIADVVDAVRQAKTGETTTPEPAMENNEVATEEPAISMIDPKILASAAPPVMPAPTSFPQPMAMGTAPAPMPTAMPQSSTPVPQPMAKAEPMPLNGVSEEPVAASSATTSADDGIEALIIDIIAERTGFPKETLTSDLRLLDDLNMDSIKAGDIIATAARKLGALGPIDPATLADASIADVVTAVRAAKHGDAATPMQDSATPTESVAIAPTPIAPASVPATDKASPSTMPQMPTPMAQAPAMPMPTPMVMPTPTATATASSSATMAAPESPQLAPQDDLNWVANFDVEYVAHRPKAMQQDISNRHFKILYQPGDDEAFMAKLADQFHERKATISFEPFDQPGQSSGDAHPEGAPLYIVAILPRNAGAGSTTEKLQRMIDRLRRSVENTKLNAKPSAAGVCLVQFGNAHFGQQGMSDIECCTAAGFARALHLETPSLEVRIVDIADKLSHILATDFITNEIAAPGSIRDCSYDRLGRRFEIRHRKVKADDYAAKPLSLNSSDTIIVTGGARGITAELALALAERTKANFALVGSSPHPKQSMASSDAEIASNLSRFQALNIKCEYFSCDLSNIDAVKQMVDSVESSIGRITGIIHGAGRNHPKQASAPSTGEVLAEISPKVLGAMHLLEALGNRSLNCFVGLTSIIGVTGIPGNSWYAFSNETLDLILRQYQVRHPESLVRSVSYSAWSDVGMGAQAQVEAALKRMGVGLIPPQKGIESFMYAMEHDLPSPQLIVSGSLGGIDTFHPSESAAGENRIPADDESAHVPCAAAVKPMAQSRRYVGSIVEEQPNQSVVTRVKLTHDDDPYLLDHIYEGTCLFPAVFGLEAMSQVAAYLMPEDKPQVVRIQNVELARPIICGPEGEVELEIRSQLLKKCPDSGESTFKVAIRTERTQFHFEHFACEVVFGKQMVGASDVKKVGKPLDLCPQRDLYTGILFQGPMFRRWRDTYSLVEGKMDFDVAHCSKTLAGEGIFGCLSLNGPTVTGDPYFRDVLLQSVQAIIPQKTGLPLSIERIEFYVPSNTTADSDHRLVTSHLHQIADEVGEEHVAEIVARDADGTIRERMVGYRVKVLAIKEQYPTAAELANLTSFEQKLLDQQTSDMFAGTDAESPVMMIRRMPELHGMSKEDRHRKEHPQLTKTVHRLKLRSKGGDSAAPAIGWKESGAPVTLGDEHYAVSLSHDDDYCLTAANLMVSGCDIQTVDPRERDQWEALLGSHNYPLLDQLMASGDCLNTAGTRIWSAVEAVQKSIDDATPVSLRMVSASEGTVELVSDQMAQDTVLVTKPVHLHRGPKRMVAVVAPKTSLAETAPNAASMVHVLSSEIWMGNLAEPKKNGTHNGAASLNGAMYSNGQSHGNGMAMSAEPSMRKDVAERGESRSIDNVKAEIKWDGPRDQAVFEHKFVVTFKEAAMRGKHVQHTQYLGWMGHMRENGLLYLVPDMVLKLSDGLSGMATNWTDVDIVGEAMMGDVIVARLWMVEMTDATVTLGCDFAKQNSDGRLERLAYVEQATTWVRLDGRNDPIKEPFPKFLLDAFKSMEPHADRIQMLPELPASLGRVKLEQQKLEQITPKQPVVLWHEDFSTCLDDSNIVANIYYARYFHWQWRTSDLFFYSKAPHLMTGDVAMGNVRELVPLNSRIDYVRDAFPFDRIRTELAVTRFTESAATFQYTHYRVHEGGRIEKLSAGTQDVCWIRRTPNGAAVPEPFPLAIREAFKGAMVMG